VSRAESKQYIEGGTRFLARRISAQEEMMAKQTVKELVFFLDHRTHLFEIDKGEIVMRKKRRRKNTCKGCSLASTR
jgi:hypothetical protein